MQKKRQVKVLPRSASGRSAAIRWAAFVAGVVINSFGIAFITKAAMGTSPISSVPYVLSLYFPLSLGLFSFIFNMLYIVLQFVLLGRAMKPIQLLQVAVNIVFSSAIDVSMSLLSWLNPEGIAAQAASLVAGCLILAFGVALEVAPGVLLVPGEGIVRALAIRTKMRFGSMKVIFDVTLMVSAVILSFVLFGRLNGIGIGTVVSALLVGRFVNLFNRRFGFLDRLRAMQGVTETPAGAAEAEAA